MKKFKEFELQKPEFILGGEIRITTCGTHVCDYYDTDRDVVIFLPPEN